MAEDGEFLRMALHSANEEAVRRGWGYVDDDEPPLVSVIVAAWEPRPAWLRAAVESALAQEVALEILVTDDGSQRPVADVLKDLRARVLRQANAGPAAARNRAIREARGEWLAFLDQDDLWDGEKLEAQLAAAVDADVVHTGARLIDAEGRVLEERMAWPGPVGGVADLLAANRVVCSTVLARRSLVNLAGGFPEGNRAACDYGLWLALASLGARFAFVEGPLASYRVHGAQVWADPARAAGDVRAALSWALEVWGGAWSEDDRAAWEARMASSRMAGGDAG